MAITVSLTSTQACFLGLTVIGIRGAAASPVGQWVTGSSDMSALIMPDGSGSLIVGCAYSHFTTATPNYLSPFDANTQLINDSQGLLRGALTFRSASPATVAGVPIIIGAANSGLQDERQLALLEVLAGAGGISIDPVSPAPVPATAPQNNNLTVGGTTTTRVTAAFTPDPTSVLVALAVGTFGAGASLTASDSASAYTWSHPAVISNGSGNAWVNIGIPPTPRPAVPAPPP